MNEELKRAGIGCPYCGKDLYVGFDVCPHCGNQVPNSLLQLVQSMHGNKVESPITDTRTKDTLQKGIEPLTHFEELEDDSKTKIGTFERLYEDYMNQSKMRGFDDTDFAPLVNPLGSALELELSKSLYEKLIPYWKIVVKRNGLGDMPIREKCMLGHMTTYLKFANEKHYQVPNEVKDVYAFVIQNIGEDWSLFTDQLNIIRDTRNDADHKVVISQERFYDFYRTYHTFYEQYMPFLLELKSMHGSYGYYKFYSFRQEFPNFSRG